MTVSISWPPSAMATVSSPWPPPGIAGPPFRVSDLGHLLAWRELVWSCAVTAGLNDPRSNRSFREKKGASNELRSRLEESHIPETSQREDCPS